LRGRGVDGGRRADMMRWGRWRWRGRGMDGGDGAGGRGVDGGDSDGADMVRT